MIRLVRNGSPAGAPFEPPAPVLVALGSAYFRSRNRAAAEKHWSEAVAVDRGIGEAWNNLAVIYLTSGRKAAARAAVDNAERAGIRRPRRAGDCHLG